MRQFAFTLVLIFFTLKPSALGSNDGSGQWICQEAQSLGQSWGAFRKTFEIVEKPSNTWNQQLDLSLNPTAFEQSTEIPGLTFIKETDEHITYTLEPGTWKITAR